MLLSVSGKGVLAHHRGPRVTVALIALSPVGGKGRTGRLESGGFQRMQSLLSKAWAAVLYRELCLKIEEIACKAVKV